MSAAVDIRLRLRIERDWMQPPGWFATLPEAIRLLLVADYFRVHTC